MVPLPFVCLCCFPPALLLHPLSRYRLIPVLCSVLAACPLLTGLCSLFKSWFAAQDETQSNQTALITIGRPQVRGSHKMNLPMPPAFVDGELMMLMMISVYLTHGRH